MVWLIEAVKRVSVIGDFNGWRRHPMRVRGDSGIWEIFIPGLAAGTAYKYEILTVTMIVVKTDPYAQQMFMRPETTPVYLLPRLTAGKMARITARETLRLAT